MQRFVSRYGTAAHLALLTAAPLFLFPLLSATAASVALLWLSLFAATWVFMAPASRRGEMPHDARGRVVRETVRDPVFWISLAVVAWAGLRAVNTGAGLVYDAEVRAWSLCGGRFEDLPGSAAGAGLPVFACAVACAVALLSTRHALDAAGRIVYALVMSVLVALAAVGGWFAISYGWPSFVEMARCDWMSPSFAGASFAVGMLVAEVAIFGSVELDWHRAEPVAFVGLVGCALGTVVFSPLALTVLAMLLVFLQMAWSALTSRHTVPGTGIFRCVIATLIALAAAAAALFVSGPGTPLGVRGVELQKLVFVPGDFLAVRAAVSDVAIKAWRGAIWFGTGIGTFADVLTRYSPDAMWTTVDPRQSGSLNGWWQLLAERGASGALVFALVTVSLVVTYVAGAVRRGLRFSHLRPIHGLAPLVLVLFAVVTTFGTSFFQVGAMLASAAALSLSASAMSPAGSAERRNRNG